MRAAILFMLVFTSLKIIAQQTGENKLGNWMMYFGTTSISDRISIHSELQVRLYEPLSNFNQLLPRVGLNYHISSDAIATAGYAYIPTESFEKEAFRVYSTEHRIWEQFILRNSVGRFLFEHRYRLEQRWISTGSTDSYRDRIRYRLLVTVPLSHNEMLSNTWFVSVYDEIFLNVDNAPFDQNRLYLALGYKLNNSINLQSGYLRHRIGSLSYDRLQFAIFWNASLSNKNRN